MSDSITTVKQIYQSFLTGDVPAILAKLAEDVVWEPDTTDHGIPWVKPRKGRENIPLFFEALQGLQINKFEPQNFLAGANQVAVTIRLEGTALATGTRITEFEIHLWTFRDDGLVSHFKHFIDTKNQWEAVFG